MELAIAMVVAIVLVFVLIWVASEFFPEQASRSGFSLIILGGGLFMLAFGLADRDVRFTVAGAVALLVALGLFFGSERRR